MRVRGGKLLHKLLPVFLTLSIGPLVWAAWTLIRIGNDYVATESRTVRLGIAQKVAGNVADYIQNVKNILQVVHKSSDFLAMDPRRQTAVLSNVMNAYPMFMRMAVLDMRSLEISAINRMGDSAFADGRDNASILRSIRSLGDYVGPVSRSPEGYPQMTIAVPIERIPGRPVGALVGVVNLIDLSSLIKNLLIGKTGYVYMVDMANRQLVAHPQVDLLLSPNPPSEVSAALLTPEESSFGAIEFADQAKRKFVDAYATVPIPRLRWRVFVQQPMEEAYQASSRMRHQFVRVLIGVITVTVILAFLLSHGVVKRVKRLQAAMEQVGEGNFDVPQVPASNDEFGRLTGKFVWMARSLKDKTLRLLAAQQELQRWNTDLERRVQERTRALQEAQEQLIAQEKLAALGQMASVVGHELRNPLAVMNNSVYFLKSKLASLGSDPKIDPKIEKHLQILETEIVKSNSIIRDVLDFARNRGLNASPHKVDELVEKAIERIQFPPNVILKKELTLNGTEAMVDEDEIRQVLVNLMENACQAMTSGGTLSVGTRAYASATQRGARPPDSVAGGSDPAAASWVDISIGDTGCGIPKEHLSKIFAPFFTTKSRGTGLGLAVVKKIIDRHKGVIEVQSVTGEGTVFHVKLPRNVK